MSGDIIQVHEAYLVDRKSVGITHTHRPFWVMGHGLTQFKVGMPVLEFFCKLQLLFSMFAFSTVETIQCTVSIVGLV